MWFVFDFWGQRPRTLTSRERTPFLVESFKNLTSSGAPYAPNLLNPGHHPVSPFISIITRLLSSYDLLASLHDHSPNRQEGAHPPRLNTAFLKKGLSSSSSFFPFAETTRMMALSPVAIDLCVGLGGQRGICASPIPVQAPRDCKGHA